MDPEITDRVLFQLEALRTFISQTEAELRKNGPVALSNLALYGLNIELCGVKIQHACHREVLK